MDVAAYGPALAAAAVVAGAFLLQILVADLAGIRAGHTPGMPVTDGHASFHFRATRAHANSNENLPVFTLLLVVAVLAGTSPTWTARWTWLFAAARVGHMAAYYADQRLARSVAFGVGLVALLGLFATIIFGSA